MIIRCSLTSSSSSIKDYADCKDNLKSRKNHSKFKIQKELFKLWWVNMVHRLVFRILEEWIHCGSGRIAGKIRSNLGLLIDDTVDQWWSQENMWHAMYYSEFQENIITKSDSLMLLER